MQLRKIKAVYSIVVGISILALWIMLFLTGQIPELETELFRISFHIFSELLLAIILVISGIGLLRKSKTAEKLFLLAMGLLLYSVINAAGYYGQNGDYTMVIMFSVVCFASVFFLVSSIKSDCNTN